MHCLKHEEACVSLKFLLEVAFQQNDQRTEIIVYERLAMCHFYLQNLKSCQYYLMRTTRNLVDPPDSDTRQIYSNVRYNFTQAKLGYKTMDDFQHGKKDIFELFRSVLHQHSFSGFSTATLIQMLDTDIK